MSVVDFCFFLLVSRTEFVKWMPVLCYFSDGMNRRGEGGSENERGGGRKGEIERERGKGT